MGYSFPGRRTQFTNMVVHSSAVLDPGGSANFGSMTVEKLTALSLDTFNGTQLRVNCI